MKRETVKKVRFVPVGATARELLEVYEHNDDVRNHNTKNNSGRYFAVWTVVGFTSAGNVDTLAVFPLSQETDAREYARKCDASVIRDTRETQPVPVAVASLMVPVRPVKREPEPIKRKRKSRVDANDAREPDVVPLHRFASWATG